MITVLYHECFCLVYKLCQKKKVLALVNNRPSYKCPLSLCVPMYNNLLVFYVVVILFLLKQ
jgi:hypothetical protein